MKLASKKSALVLDGNEIKHRLEAERTLTQTPVHIDWVRFTVQRRNAPTPPVDVLFPGKAKATGQEFDAAWFRFQRLLETSDTSVGRIAAASLTVFCAVCALFLFLQWRRNVRDIRAVRAAIPMNPSIV